MKRILSTTGVFFVLFLIGGCGSSTQSENATTNASAPKKDSVADKGIGKFKDIKLNSPLDESMASNGKAVYDAKCIACHKLTNEKLVGPGWAGISNRRTPEWIMNFITNTNVMLDSDLVAQQLMVICTTRMPNQNLSDDMARCVLEYMRKNDGKK
jgi:mono/diheme cytochrome c family protein